MTLKKRLAKAAKSGETPGFATLCLFSGAMGCAALLNIAAGGDPRFTAFAACLCALGMPALLAMTALIIGYVNASRDHNARRPERHDRNL